jgi:hypothetical protein
MKKIFFLMLTLIFVSAASVNAQVTIGSANDPHSGAVLDLQSTTQGLKLPNVALNDDLTEFGLPVQPPTFTAANAKGMFVYNTNPNVGEGVFVWDGSQWGLVSGSVGANPVTGITINGDGGATSVICGTTLQLSVVIDPVDASNPIITWSIGSGREYASVDKNGLVTGLHVGTVIVLAQASNGVYGEIELLVTNSGQTVPEEINGIDYLTYNFDGLVWMVENLKEVPASGTGYKTTYNGDGTVDLNYNEGEPATPGERGYYYNYDTYETMCHEPWSLPSPAQYNALRDYMLYSETATEYEKELFQGESLAGRFNTNTWQNWGIQLNFYLTQGRRTVVNNETFDTPSNGNNTIWISIRCVRSAK